MNDHVYEFSSIENTLIENVHETKSSSENECNILNTLDTLLQTLNEPDHILQSCTNNTCDTPIALNQKQIS